MSPGEKSGRRESLPISFITLIARTLQKSLTATESDGAIVIPMLIYSCTAPHWQYLPQDLYKSVEYDINIQVIKGENSTMVSISDPKFVDVGEINQRSCLEESGQWLENVNQTNLVPASAQWKAIATRNI